MAMVVRSNMMAMNANRQLGMNSSSVSKGLEKLSSGFKINRAGDDASGLAISEKMKAQIKGLEQASSNSQDGISLVQTAEGALTEVHSMLNRMVELATKSSNGTIQDEVDREAIQSEVDALISEIDRIGDSTNFNGINLLDGTQSAKGGSSAVTAIKSDANLTDVAATKYKNEAGQAITGGATFATGANAKEGATYSYTVTYEENGKSLSKTFSLTQEKGADGTLKMIGASGKEYALANNGDAANMEAALLQEMRADKSFSNSFAVSGDGTGIFTFAAKNEGSNGGKVLSTSNQLVDKAGVDIVASTTLGNVTTTGGADASKALAAADIKSYDPTAVPPVTEKDATITVNGKKFLLAAVNTDISKVDKNTTVVFGAGTTGYQSLASAISQKTGLSVTGAATGLSFKAGAGNNSTGGLTLQIGDTGDDFNMVKVSVEDMRSKNLGVAGLDVSGPDAARAAIQTVKDGINMVSTNRANLGAMQNRLEYTINNLDVTAENMNAANSRIRDTDMAKQMMDYTKMNVLTQSAQAMLAQANQQPQSILQLLQ